MQTKAACWSQVSNTEALASQCASDSCYRSFKNIFVHAVIVDEGTFSNVERQILAADVVMNADDGALQHGPEALNRIRVDCADDILAGRVPHELMREHIAEHPITRVFVGREQANFGRDGLANKAVESLGIGVRDDAGDNVALARYGSDDWRLARSGPAAHAVALIPMAVLGFAADERLVYFDNAHELLELFVLKRDADAMTHVPSGLVAAEAHDAVDLAGRNALFGSQHHVNDAEPLAQIDVGILKNGSDKVREAISATLTAFRAFPLKFHRLKRIDLVRAAARACNAIRPALSNQILVTSNLVRERFFPLGDAHLHDLAGLLCAGHGFIPQCEGTLP